MTRLARRRLFNDAEFGCSREHPERRTHASVVAAFERLRDELELLEVRGAVALVAEAQVRALSGLARRPWTEDLQLVEGELVCHACRSEDFYERVAERLYAEGSRSPAVLRAVAGTAQEQAS